MITAAAAGTKAFSDFTDAIMKWSEKRTEDEKRRDKERKESAREEKARLIALRARLVQLEAEKLQLAAKIQRYVERPSVDRWQEVARLVPAVTREVVRVLEALKEERSDFVVVPQAYWNLVVGLESRKLVLLADMPSATPTTQEEIAKLGELGEKLDTEIRSITRASEALAGYVQHRFGHLV